MFWFLNGVIKLLSSAQCSAELLRIWSTLPLVHSVASTELSLASKIHNNRLLLQQSRSLRKKSFEIMVRKKSSSKKSYTTERKISTVLWTKAVLNLENHRKRIKVWKPCISVQMSYDICSNLTFLFVLLQLSFLKMVWSLTKVWNFEGWKGTPVLQMKKN